MRLANLMRGLFADQLNNPVFSRNGAPPLKYDRCAALRILPSHLRWIPTDHTISSHLFRSPPHLSIFVNPLLFLRIASHFFAWIATKPTS